jgi:hypothetical protein
MKTENFRDKSLERVLCRQLQLLHYSERTNFILKIVKQISNASLKGQSHEKFGEMRARGLSLGHN